MWLAAREKGTGRKAGETVVWKKDVQGRGASSRNYRRGQASPGRRPGRFSAATRGDHSTRRNIMSGSQVGRKLGLEKCAAVETITAPKM